MTELNELILKRVVPSNAHKFDMVQVVEEVNFLDYSSATRIVCKKSYPEVESKRYYSLLMISPCGEYHSSMRSVSFSGYSLEDILKKENVELLSDDLDEGDLSKIILIAIENRNRISDSVILLKSLGYTVTPPKKLVSIP